MYFVSTIVSRFLRDVKSNRNRSLDAARHRSTPLDTARRRGRAPGDHISSARRLYSVSGAAHPRVVLLT